MAKLEWLCILPDAPGKLQARMEIRQQHLANIQDKATNGTVVLGGPTLDAQPKEGEAMQVNGSVVLVEAETEAEVRALIEGDVYYKTGVWDAGKVQIIPFKTAVRRG